MIISRTPLRISIGGGGSDLPSFYERFGGFFVSAAIDKYIYIALNKTFTGKYAIRYSTQELVDAVADIKHPIVREVMTAHGINPIEMVSLADIPAGTGLGSSGSFTVGLLRAVYAWKREQTTPGAIAEEACDIEMNRLNEPVGKQDQYIASYGGFTCFEIDKKGTVSATPLPLKPATIHALEDHLLLFFTGYSRSASSILADQNTKSTKADAGMLDNLQYILEVGHAIKAKLLDSDLNGFAELMHQHWLRKKVRSDGISNADINRWYDMAMANGARGGKLVGAGGGGFLMFYADDAAGVRAAMAEAGLEEVRFKFDFDGSIVMNR